MGEEISNVFRTTWTRFGDIVATFLPRFLSLLALVVLGWVTAFVLGRLTRRGLKWARFDGVLERVGLTPTLARIGGPPPHALVASFVFWVVWLSFLLAGLSALGFDAAEQLSADLVRLIPRLAVAIVVVLIGYALANFLWRAVLLWAVNAHVQQAKLLSGMVRALVLIAAFAMALEQLGVGERVMHTAFAVVMGAIAGGWAIAFGLGGRHIARRYLEQRVLSRESPRPPEEGGGTHL